MKLDKLKQLPADTVKQLLSEKEISVRDIADTLKINHSAVVCVINGNYKGAEATKEKIYKKIAAMLEGREELSDDIYDNISTVDKLLHVGINSAKFNIPEKEFLISLHKKLNNYKVNQQQN